MNSDLINGLFELSAAGFLALSVRRVLKDRAVKGVSPTATAFFFAWGVWNIYFYPSQGLTWSFWGGVAVVIINLVYLLALIYFSNPHPAGSRAAAAYADLVRTIPTDLVRTIPTMNQTELDDFIEKYG